MKSDRIVWLLALMMGLLPALGSPTEELLQDTLKSILASFFVLFTALLYFWDVRKISATGSTIQLHGLLLLPLSLMAYALGSMAWSHMFLGGVEAIRWFIFSLLVFIGVNCLTSARLTPLAWGIHLGAVISSMWTALQFWVDFSFFAQGPNPASTFVNRNFFGEFLVCTLPYSVLLLTRIKDKTSVILLTFSLAFNVVALMMTGTRSALVGLIILGVLIPTILFLYRKQVVSTGWRAPHLAGLVAVFVSGVLLLGSIQTNNSKMLNESGRINALERAMSRTLSITNSSEYSEGSFSIRAVMWKATGRMIQAHPFAGVGAGAWEVHTPIYQNSAGQLETDYYAHNEILQLLAEYGLIGWLFLIALLGYLAWAAYATWSNKSALGQQEAIFRGMTLSSLLVLLLVSNAGFPWHMATTGALFALSLAILGASDIRLGVLDGILASTLTWKIRYSNWSMMILTICTALAIYIAQQAIECESKIVRAVKIAITISQSGYPKDARWDHLKSEMITLLREGVTINPHYRKLTPIVADSLASWGDWKNATWIWESVLGSRPYVVALLANVTRGHIQAGNFPKAEEILNRAITLQPSSPVLATLQVILWTRNGKEIEATNRAKELVKSGIVDPDLLRTAYFLGMRHRDPELAIMALEQRIKTWPDQAVDGWLKLGHIYAAPESKNEERAFESYRSALAATEPQHRTAVWAMIPPKYRDKLILRPQ
jgi:O-antigen ligase